MISANWVIAPRKIFEVVEMALIMKDGKEMRVPSSWQKFNTEVGLHPTQKPVALFEYLIKTYTNEGDLVLDNTAGSCTTAVAAKTLKRNWICIEKEQKYCEVGKKRLDEIP